MRRHRLRWVLALAGLAVLVVVGVIFVLWPQPERITRQNFDRIREGMTRADVEAILGPPGDHRTRLGETNLLGQNWLPDSDEYDPGVATWRAARGNAIEGHISGAVWIGDTLDVRVFVDDTGRVFDASADERRTTKHALDSLFWRVRHQWRRWLTEK
jgi:hypothetical protein